MGSLSQHIEVVLMVSLHISVQISPTQGDDRF